MMTIGGQYIAPQIPEDIVWDTSFVKETGERIIVKMRKDRNNESFVLLGAYKVPQQGDDVYFKVIMGEQEGPRLSVYHVDHYEHTVSFSKGRRYGKAHFSELALEPFRPDMRKP